MVVFSDSQLIVNQATSEYIVRDKRIMAYAKVVIKLLAQFRSCRLQQVCRDDNSHVDALANLASSIKSDSPRTIIVDYLSSPSVEPLITE